MEYIENIHFFLETNRPELIWFHGKTGKSKRMPKPNTRFELDVEDLDLIETALRKAKREADIDSREVADLLGRLHNQKVFYRPDGTYVGG